MNLGLNGGKSENRRLFSEDHETCAEIKQHGGVERMKRFCMLHRGKNHLRLSYEQTGADVLEFDLTLPNEKDPMNPTRVLKLSSPGDKRGTFERDFDLK